MTYYEKTLELLKLNDRVNALKAKLYSLDGVNVSYTTSTTRGKSPKGDKIGRIVANREELIAEIEALEEQRKPYINDVRKALWACCNHNLENSIKSHRIVSNVIECNFTIEEVCSLSNIPISRVQSNIRNYLNRMKEGEENGTLVIGEW